MIASITGKLLHSGLDWVVVEVGGIGLQLFVTPASVSSLLSQSGPVSLYTYLVVRDDALVLYGFPSSQERETFEILLGVSGIGPRTALAALSVLSPTELAEAVETSDLKTLQRVPGVGKKSAQRLVLELGGRLALAAEDRSEQAPTSGVRDEVQLALEHLGWTKVQAEKTLAKIPEDHGDASALLRAALAELGGARG